MQNPRLNTLIETIEISQKLVGYYVSLLKETNPKKVFKTEGQELNSLYWLVGHLAWAENMLILDGTFGTGVKYAWLKNFEFGAGHHIDDNVTFEELKAGAKAVHEQAIAHLKP